MICPETYHKATGLLCRPMAWIHIRHKREETFPFDFSGRVATVPQLETLQDVSAQEEEELQGLTTDVCDYGDREGKLKYDAEFIEV